MEFKKFGEPFEPFITYTPNELKSNFVIFNNGCFSDSELIKGDDDSIFSKDTFNLNVKFDSFELLLNSINFGKDLYNTFNGTFKTSFFLHEENDCRFNGTPIFFTSPSFNKSEIIELFKSWFRITGFTNDKIIPKETYNSKDNTERLLAKLQPNVSISYEKIKNLMYKYIILYLYASVLFEIDKIIDEGKNINNKRSLNKFNSLLKRVDLKSIAYKGNYIKDLYEKKEDLLMKLQFYTNYFKPQITPYITLYKKNDSSIPPFECKNIDTSNSLFDLIWTTFIKVIISGASLKSLTICEDCGILFEKLDERKKRCDDCSYKRIRERSKAQREERKQLIADIISFKNLKITDKTSLSYIAEIEDLTCYGHSKEKDTFSIPTLKKYKKHILENLKEPSK